MKLISNIKKWYGNKLIRKATNNLVALGYTKTKEDEHGSSYIKYVPKFDYTGVLDIRFKYNGNNLIHSYVKDENNKYKITNTLTNQIEYFSIVVGVDPETLKWLCLEEKGLNLKYDWESKRNTYQSRIKNKNN